MEAAAVPSRRSGAELGRPWRRAADCWREVVGAGRRSGVVVVVVQVEAVPNVLLLKRVTDEEKLKLLCG